MHPLLRDEPGSKMFLLGNEAIARGALEAGVSFATCYPGTPSSEIPEQFFRISQEVSDLYFEYSTNEKVALEVGAGAAQCGIRTMVTMKHVGVNVAADPLMTLAYTGVVGGMVIVTADDPSLFSSQNEQDNRYYARLSSLPMLEPTTVQELKDVTRIAFELSEELKLPVLLRTTTRLNHIRAAVELGKLSPRKLDGSFQKNPFSLVAVPAVSRKLHKELLDKYERAQEKAEQFTYNQCTGKGKAGIVASGVSVNYVRDAIKDLGLEEQVKFLKLVFTWPLPKNLIKRFLKSVEKVLVVEELEPILETEIKAIAHESGLSVPIKGKGVGGMSRLLEYDPALVRKAVAEFVNIPYTPTQPLDLSDLPPLPGRPPNLCAGCPHRATYYEVKEVFGGESVFPNDIGCYTLGLLPPISMADFLICMGSSVSSGCGFSRVQPKKVVSFIGDSTFFHSGITGLIDAVHNNHNFTLVILDNGTTAMTGHQPHPGVDPKAVGLNKTQIDLEALVKGCGVKDVHVIEPYKVKKSIETLKKAYEYEGMSVVIAKELCPLFARATNQFKRGRPFRINHEKCKNHRLCVNKLACLAMYLEGDRVQIDRNLCIGCAVCAQICPENAIVPAKE
ncbi:MAG: indolepyruvate ferredoxin oxidoreductase subunit alpha [Desulfatiglandales bacterium]